MRKHLRTTAIWVVAHIADFTLISVFAVLLVLPLTGVVSILAEGPYKIYLVTNQTADAGTINAFRTTERGWRDLLRLSNVPVQLQLEFLPAPDLSAVTATTLAARSDTLIVIGDLPSSELEQALPLYLGATPPIPVISTIASADNLLAQCNKRKCVDENGFAPLLQLSPINSLQAASAIRYAMESNSKRFLIVEGGDVEYSNYSMTLAELYKDAIVRYGNSAVEVTETIRIDALKGKQGFDPDCIFYIGNIAGDDLSTLFKYLSKIRTHHALVVFDDSALRSRTTLIRVANAIMPRDSINNGLTVRFMSSTSAADYDSPLSTYVGDALAVSSQLIMDLNDQSESIPSRLYSFLHVRTAVDARKDLVRVIKEKLSSRTWYKGQKGELYMFEKNQRTNGMFHVLAITLADGKGVVLTDVDHWHQ